MNATMDIEQVRAYLPLLIPLVIVQLALFFYVLIHIFKHDHYKHGNRVLWLVIVLLGSNFVGPILYLILGKEEE
jgi:uncharacterized membrane protein YozB (DUF420 family)